MISGNGAAMGTCSDMASQYIVIRLGEYFFGIDITPVEEVFIPQRISSVPGAGTGIVGVVNLRGRIITMIDPGCRLGLPRREGAATSMAVGLVRNHEIYGLLVDDVYDVLRIDEIEIKRNPANLSPDWQSLSNGVVRYRDRLLVLLNVEGMLDELSGGSHEGSGVIPQRTCKGAVNETVLGS